MAQSVQGTNTRIQFTPDLLPGDITGISVYDQKEGVFEFHAGPIFANIVLADEINRASPKTQSALLEVMEEGSVTIDGVSRQVGVPFLVLATQNPVEQAGHLPAARGAARPLHDAHLARLPRPRRHRPHPRRRGGADGRPRARSSRRRRSSAWPTSRAQVYVDALVLDYIARLVDSTRSADEVRLGVSIRGALALTRAARTRAASQGRTYATPDDVKALAVAVLSHRLILHPEAEFDGVTQEAVIGQVLLDVAPPTQARGGMSLTESRLTRTSAATGTGGRTHVTATAVTSARRGRALVRVVVWWTGAWRAEPQRGRLAPRRGAPARCARPGCCVVLAATVGLATGDRVRLGRVDGGRRGRDRAAAHAGVPFLFGARSYDVDLSLAHERIVAGDGVSGEIVVRNHGRRIALPGRIDIPVGEGLVEFGVPLLRPGHSRRAAARDPGPAPRHRHRRARRRRCAATRSACCAASTRSTTSTSCTSTRARPRLPSTSAGLIRDLEGSPTRRLVDSDMSFHAIREYAPGRLRAGRSTGSPRPRPAGSWCASTRSRAARAWRSCSASPRPSTPMPTSSSSPSAARRRSACGPCATRATSRS